MNVKTEKNIFYWLKTKASGFLSLAEADKFMQQAVAVIYVSATLHIQDQQ